MKKRKRCQFWDCKLHTVQRKPTLETANSLILSAFFEFIAVILTDHLSLKQTSTIGCHAHCPLCWRTIQLPCLPFIIKRQYLKVYWHQPSRDNHLIHQPIWILIRYSRDAAILVAISFYCWHYSVWSTSLSHYIILPKLW